MVHLYTTYYQDKNQSRAFELEFCTIKNVSLPYSFFTIFIDETEELKMEQNLYRFFTALDNCKIIKKQSRPSFNDIFHQIAEDSKDASPYDVFIIFNTDIYINNPSAIYDYLWALPKNNALALSRWDKMGDSEVLFERADSQDVWAFRDVTNINLPLQINFGVAGCDNRLAYELEQQGYTLLNPCKSIKTIHFHESAIRNYINNGEVKERIPPPYKLVQPF